jgi:phosphohistidine phosphatase
LKLLHLFRHAKSSWTDEGLDDHDRPLAERGRKAAQAMGRYFAAHGIRPDLVLISSSARTRATFELALGGARPRLKTAVVDELYLAGAGELLRRIRASDDAVASLMLIGHNPGMHELALALVGEGAVEERRQLARKYPTAALASLEFAVDRWRRLTPGSGRLVRYILPKNLSDDRIL